MKRSNWFVGIDLGTGSCKSVVVDGEARVLVSALRNIPVYRRKTDGRNRIREIS